jgi:hypothetical protein
MEEHSYWEQIEHYFVNKRGSALILSPKDWPLVSSWEERHIPLEVIYKGIDKAFTRFEEKATPVQRRKMQTLSYCRYDVEQEWKVWKEQHPELREPDAQELFEAERRRLITKLRGTINQLQNYAANPHYADIHEALLAAAETLASYIMSLEQAEDEALIAELREAIHDVEQNLITHLEQGLPEKIRQTLYTKAEARVSSHKDHMTDSVYQETLQLAFLQELHKTYPLPSFL